MKKSVVVVGAVIPRDGKIFAAQRSEAMSLPGTWEFPGGKIEHGETPQEALRRELEEELGITRAVVGNFVTETTHEYEFAIVSLSTYVVDIGDEDPVLAEHSEARWIDVADLKSVDWAPADIPAVELVMAEFGG